MFALVLVPRTATSLPCLPPEPPTPERAPCFFLRAFASVAGRGRIMALGRFSGLISPAGLASPCVAGKASARSRPSTGRSRRPEGHTLPYRSPKILSHHGLRTPSRAPAAPDRVCASSPLTSLVRPHPPPGPCQRRLYRRVRVLQGLQQGGLEGRVSHRFLRVSTQVVAAGEVAAHLLISPLEVTA
jgi:hypothetical protein